MASVTIEPRIRKEQGFRLTATASNYRGKAGAYSAGNAADKSNETYWATDDDVTTASLEINTGKVQTIKYVMLQEYIKLGQRVKSFTVEVWNNDAWQQVAAGTTIGYKRILKLTPVRAGKVRININGIKSLPGYFECVHCINLIDKPNCNKLLCGGFLFGLIGVLIAGNVYGSKGPFV